jgi:amidase
MKIRSFLIVFTGFVGLLFTSQVKSQSQQSEMEFKVLDSKYLTKETIFASVIEEVEAFDKTETLKPLIIGKTIPELQASILGGEFSYRDLTLFYLCRIYKYDRENPKSLNSVVSINPGALQQAEKADDLLKNLRLVQKKRLLYSVMGMPILLKDNIDVAGMVTTAGAAVMLDNKVSQNSNVTERLLKQNAVILGKTNLSEWAYYFCGTCPSGYSAVGGQTLNPYGRKVMDTGGSSSGSAVAVAAEFAVAAMGTETAGSIISPASQNSLVGVKPSLSLNDPGIIPISTYLDQAGPITRFVIDNAIVSLATTGGGFFAGYQELNTLNEHSVVGDRIGVYKKYLSNTLYSNAVNLLKKNGAIIIELEDKKIDLPGFLTILNADMQKDLPRYFQTRAAQKYNGWDVSTVMKENFKDSLLMMPYGQRLFFDVVNDTTSRDRLKKIKSNLKDKADDYYYDDIEKFDLDTILSINNYDAAIAAAARYMLLTVPMGYNEQGVPFGLTFISITGLEFKSFDIAAAYERMAQIRKPPSGYFD